MRRQLPPLERGPVVGVVAGVFATVGLLLPRRALLRDFRGAAHASGGPVIERGGGRCGVQFRPQVGLLAVMYSVRLWVVLWQVG